MSVMDELNQRIRKLSIPESAGFSTTVELERKRKLAHLRPSCEGRLVPAGATDYLFHKATDYLHDYLGETYTRKRLELENFLQQQFLFL